MLQIRVLVGDVLEVGSGPGANAQAIVERFPGIRLTATDVDEAMVSAARRRLEGIDEVIAVRRANITALPFEDDSVDAVVSLLMLHHVIDWETGLAECLRVLRPGGVLAGYDLLDTAPSRLLHRIDRSEHRMIAAVDLEARLNELRMGDIRVSSGLGGLVARFSAVKASGRI